MPELSLSCVHSKALKHFLTSVFLSVNNVDHTDLLASEHLGKWQVSGTKCPCKPRVRERKARERGPVEGGTPDPTPTPPSLLATKVTFVDQPTPVYLQLVIYSRFYFVCIGILPAYMYAFSLCISSIQGVPERSLDPLELWLQMVVSQQVGAGNWTWILGKSSQFLQLRYLNTGFRLMVLFREVMEPSGGAALLEEVRHCRQALWACSSTHFHFLLCYLLWSQMWSASCSDLMFPAIVVSDPL